MWSSSSSSDHSINDYGRYERARLSPQNADIPSTLQPARTIDQTPVIYSDNVVQQSRYSGCKSETWSFDRAINEMFRLLPQELYPKWMEENIPAKPLSEIERWSHGLLHY